LLKVCVVSQECGEAAKNGAATYAHLLIRGLLEKGVDLCLVTAEEIGLDIEQMVVDVRFPDPTPNKWLSGSYAMSKALKEKAAKGSGVDLVHFLAARDALFSGNLGLPLVGTQHDFYSIMISSNTAESRRVYPYDWFFRVPYYRIARTLEGKTLRRFDTIISVCDFTRQEIIRGFGLDEGKVFTIYNGFTPDVRTDASRAWHERENRVLFVGGNPQRKNLPLLLKALPYVKCQIPDVKVTVLGGDSHIDKLINDMVDASAAEAVESLGFVPNHEVLRFMAKSKVFAMPSLYESFAFVYLEAMSHGLPVIAGKIGGAPELIRNGIEGYLVDASDVESTAEKILELLSDEEKWTALSENCLERVGDFSVSRMVEETIGIYEEVLSAKGK
jgi:glycosyltransferase involved in cell wall biosynthesis